MANNKTHRKYAATTMAAAAAVAVAPIATSAATSFPDVTKESVPTHYDNIIKLAESGVIKGTDDGNFYPWQSIDRGQVAAMFVRAMDLEAPEDVEGTIEKYSDVNMNNEFAEEVAAVTDAGVFEGNEDGKFGVWNNINRQQMAKVLVKAFDLEDINPDKDVDTELSDVDADQREYVQILANLGITDATHDYKPFQDINRAAFSSMVVRTQEVVEEYENMEAEIDDVSAISANTLEVKFNKPLSFTEDDVKVKRGSTSVNISEVNKSDDQRSAQIELNSKLTEGEYTVTIEREDKDNITGSVKVENETVSDINVLSDVAPVEYESDDNSNLAKATVGYKVENQYGEDVTKEQGSSLEVAATGAARTAEANTDGSIEISNFVGSAEVGDTVNLTLVDKDTGVSTTKEVKLSEEAKAAEASFGDLYNKDGKELSRDSDLTEDAYYLPLTVKDQYDKEITEADKAKEDLLLTNSNPGVVQFVKDGEEQIDIQRVDIDGEEVLALEIDGEAFEKGIPGTTNVNAISKTTGNNTQTSIEVAEGNKVDSISVNKPSHIVTEGKAIYFPLNVTDKNGNEVTTKKALKTLDNAYETTPEGSSKVVEKDGGLFIKVSGEYVKEGTPVTALIIANGETANQSVTPKAAVEPKVITGLKDDASTEVRKGKTGEIKLSDLVIEDQYGQEMNDEDLEKTSPKVEVSVPEDSEVFDFDGEYSANLTQNDPVEIHAKDQNKKESEKVTFKLAGEGNSSAYTEKYTVASDSDLSSFNVEDIDDVYVNDEGKAADEKYQSEVKVTAKTKSGNTVTLKPDDYNISTSDVDYDEDNEKVLGYEGDKELGEDNESVTGHIKFTLNNSGDEVTKTVKFSTKAPKVEEAAVINGENFDDADEAAEAFADGEDVELTSYKYGEGDAFDLDKLLEDNYLAVTDQYGATVANDGDSFSFADGTDIKPITTTFSNKSSNKVVWTDNGTDSATVNAAEDGESFNATVNVDGEKTDAVKIKIDGGISADKPDDNGGDDSGE